MTRRSPAMPAVVLLLLVVFASARHAVGTGDGTARIDPVDRCAGAWAHGDQNAALRCWGTIIQQSRPEGNRRAEMNALACRGEALSTMGQLTPAELDLRAALRLATDIDDVSTQAALKGALGNLAYRGRDLRLASSFLLGSIADAQKSGARELLAASRNNMGNVVAASGAPGLAEDTYYRPAAADAAAVGDTPLQATIAINIARSQVRQGHAADARTSLEQAARFADMAPPSREQALTLIAIVKVGRTLATASHAKPDQGLLERQARHALVIANTSGAVRERSLASGLLAELLQNRGQTAEAARLNHAALADARQIGANDILWRSLWLEGRLALADGDRARALASYRAARTTLEDIRFDIPIEYTNGESSFRDEVGPLYFELTDLLISESDRIPASPPASGQLLRESFAVVESFESNEINNYFHTPCTRPPDSIAFRAAVGTNDAILYPLIRPHQIEVLISLPGGAVTHRAFPVPGEEATRTVAAFRTALETGAGYEPFARTLYDWIIRPVQDLLAQAKVDTLVVIPDGPLRNIPFGALHDGHSYLVEQFAIVTEPSIDLTARVGSNPGRERMLLSGTSERITYTEPAFAALPGVDAEISAIRSLKPDARVLPDENFTVEAMQRELHDVPYTIVHVASHAVFNVTPEESYFLTHDGRFSLDRLEAVLRGTRFHSGPLDLLILSACSTATGNDQAALGLAGIAVKAGARTAIGALWEVTDPVAEELMPAFYRNLSTAGVTKAQALRMAQLSVMRDQAHPEYRNPRYWAPFLLIGNGQ
jgi:CHAT domain-containing protein